jgi:hypothetical protein
MSTNTVTNWFGNLVSHPSVIVEAHSVDDIVTTITDPVRCPSPVRAVGSNHSTARCGVADGQLSHPRARCSCGDHLQLSSDRGFAPCSAEINDYCAGCIGSNARRASQRTMATFCCRYVVESL